MVREILDEVERTMKKSVEVFKSELATIRSSRASSTLVDGIKVEAYGTQMPIRQMASISVPDPSTIMLQPYDPSILGNIEKAIIESGRDLVPHNDGKTIWIKIPPMSEERRREIIKIVRRKAEDFRVSIRNIRAEARDKAKALKDEGKLSEDVLRRCQDEIQKLTDKYTKEIDTLVGTKEKDIMGE